MSNDRRLRRAYRFASLIAVAPIVVAAVRDGLNNWEPTWDAANTAVRVRDVFSVHPPMIGLAAAPSQQAAQFYSFPGALELYLLAVPVHVLGTTWGLLLGMATINTAALLVTFWLVRRRVGERGAIVAAVFVATLLWSLGSEVIIDPTPMQMGILPFFALLVAAWSVSDGDGPALVVLAAVGNYLVLDQLKFTLVAPALGVAALGCWVGFLLRARREDPTRWPTLRRRQSRWLAAALVVTLVVWAPPLYDQFARPDGNLGKLVHAGFHGSAQGSNGPAAAKSQPTLANALSTVTTVTAEPRLWLPTSFEHPPFGVDGGKSPWWQQTVGATVLLGGLIGMSLWARARKDRTMRRALSIGIVGWCAGVVSYMLNPMPQHFESAYFNELWPLSTFLWLAIVLGLVRLWPRVRSRMRTARVATLAIGCVAVSIFTVLAIPHADHGAGTDDQLIPSVRKMRAATAQAMRGHGPVEVANQPATQMYQPAVLLGLQDAGVEFRFANKFYVELFGAPRDALVHKDATARLTVTNWAEPPENGRRIISMNTVPALTGALYDADDRRMHQWVARTAAFRANPKLSVPPGEWRRVNARLQKLRSEAASKKGGLLRDPLFVEMVALYEILPSGPLLTVPGLTPEQVQAWAQETHRRQLGPVSLDLIPLR